MKKKKSNKTMKVFLVLIVLVLVIVLLKKQGTVFKKVQVDNNKSIEYSSVLVKEIRENHKNTLVSDLTLKTNLAFFYSQGNAQVKEELNNYFKEESDTLINNYDKIYTRYKGASKKVAYGTSLWINSKADDCSKEAKKTAKKLHYDMKVRKFNNKTQNEINRWIKKKSHGTVKEGMENDISGDQSVLMSTVYFNEKWNKKYENEDIKDGIFYGTNGEQQVTYLSSDENYYLEDEIAKGFMKPYKDKGLYFVGIKPKNNHTLDEIDVDSLMNKKQNYEVSVKIPEFEYEQTIDLKPVLKSIGINSIFEPGNLESIAKDLYVSDIYQKNYIKVNRKGTEAFSLNVSINTQWGSISGVKTVYLDEPFVFMIYDDTIKQALFIGEVYNIQ